MSTVIRDLEALEQNLSQEGSEQIVAVQNRERMVSWQRLEDAIQQLQPMIENKRTRIPVLRLLKELEERRSKVFGVDMPSKHAHTDPSGQREYKGLDPELRRRILERARGNGDAPPTVPHEPVEP